MYPFVDTSEFPPQRYEIVRLKGVGQELRRELHWIPLADGRSATFTRKLFGLKKSSSP